MASDWLAAVPPANQIPGLKFLLTNMDFNMEFFLVTQAPDRKDRAIVASKIWPPCRQK